MSSTMRPKNNCKKQQTNCIFQCTYWASLNGRVKFVFVKSFLHKLDIELNVSKYQPALMVLWTIYTHIPLFCSCFMNEHVCAQYVLCLMVYQKYQKIFQSCFIFMSKIEMFNSFSLRLSSCICGVVWPEIVYQTVTGYGLWYVYCNNVRDIAFWPLWCH